MKKQRNFTLKVALNLFVLIILTLSLAFSSIPKVQAGIPMPLVVVNLDDDGPGSLRYVIDKSTNDDTIIFADGLTGVIKLTRELYIQKSINIVGPGWDIVSVSGEGVTNVIRIAKNQTVNISGLSIINGNASKYPGGGIANDGTLSLAGMMIDSNSADTFGAGVYNGETGTLTMFQCTVSNNIALGYGGAAGGGGIWNDGLMTLNYVRVLYNTAPVAGGGIYNDITGNLTMNWVWITGNYIYGLGQGYAWGAGLMNQADYISDPDIVGWVSMYMVTINENEGTGYFSSGGGVSNIGSMSIQRSQIIDNKTSGVGGGIDNVGAMEVIQTTISGNTAYGDFGDGGGIENSGSLTLLDTTVSGNTAYGVGGGVDKWLGEMWMWNTTVSGNSAYKSGGGVFNFGHPSHINSSTIVNNTADANNDGVGEGGGLFNENEPDPTPKNSSNTITVAEPSFLPTYVTLENTILAGNNDLGGEANDCFTEPWATVTSNGHNLIFDLTSCIIDGPATGDIYNQPADLYPLANNGGPTLTHFPFVTSPVVDAGFNDTCLPTDQRGAVRPEDGDNDGIATCDIGSVEGKLGPSGNNWAPFANPQTVYTYEDTPIGITLTGADPEGDPITFALLTNPTHGTLSGTPPFLGYTPDLNYYGSDSFNFKVTDSFGGTSSATITINILPVNDAPLVDAGPDKTVIEGFPVTLDGSYLDVDEDSPPYIIWDMGDGTTIEGTLTPTYTYPDDGIYYATLYVVDSYGAVGMDYVMIVVEPRAELSISKTVSDDPALSGATLTYTITVTNTGPSNATNVIVEDQLPPELEFLSASTGCAYFMDDGKVICDVGTIPVGTSVNLQVVLKIPVTFSGDIINTASVKASEHDTNSTDDSAPVISSIKEKVALYCNDFESGAGSEWSKPLTSITPSGRSFLGEFSNEKVTLSLKDIPEHTQLRVVFDLYLIRSWDGNRLYWGNLFEASPDEGLVGPDHWTISKEGQTLLDTTFSNWDNLGFLQSYPDAYPYGNYPARFGSTEKNTLGYLYTDIPMDGVYQMSLLLKHNTENFSLDMSAYGLQPIEDESWGIDNLCVYASYGVDLLENKIYIPLTLKH